MKVCTIQLAQWRKLPDDFELVNVTLKSGNRAFSPSPQLLGDYKQGKITDEEYTERYTFEMRNSYMVNRDEWTDLLSKSRGVALSCYCGRDCFCHRKLLVDFLEKICFSKGIDFEYIGEVP